MIQIIIHYLILQSIAYRLNDDNILTTNQEFSLREDNKMFNLTFQLINETNNQLDIQIEDIEKTQFKIPDDIEPFKSIYNDIKNPLHYNTYDYRYDIEKDPFVMRIIRTDTQENIFELSNIISSELYSQFTIKVPTIHFFGLGERNQKGFRFQEGVYTLFAKDKPELIEDGKPPGKGVYSSHPVYLMRERSGKWHVMYFKNSSPMDIEYDHDKLTFKFVSGIIHLKLFLGDYDPESAIKQYHSYLSGWALHPFWSMGYHHSRWPIKNSQKLKSLVIKHKENGIPIDTIWSDLDYMFDRQIFSVDFSNFTKEDYNEIQQNLKVNYVPLIDVAVGVKYGKSDKGFREGINLDIFLRSPTTGSRLKGRVWPGASYYPDFFHPNCSTYWRTMIKSLYQQTNFSGVWIDMNEPTNFCDGECENRRWNTTLDYEDINQSYIHEPFRFPYTPGVSRLDQMTLPPHTKHYGGYFHKDVHNFYGLMESYETYMALKEMDMQPFIISRSTFPGSGHFTQHWTGDNAATYDFLYLSVGQIFQFGIFGIPMVGADVCGFMQNTTNKLCARWVQLGALYPFFRNHNNDQAYDQEFYILGDDVLHAAQKNVRLRYSLLKWYYAQFVALNHTGMVFKPLFFEFINDFNVLSDSVLDTQLMLGSELMATPILIQGQTIRKAYFPKSTWYNFHSGQRIQKEIEQASNHFVLCKYNDFVPLFIRGGKIVMRQSTQHVETIHDLNNHYFPVIAITYEDADGIMLDEGDGTVLNVQFSIRNDQAIFSIRRQVDEEPPMKAIFIDKLRIYGFPKLSNLKCRSQLSIQCESMNTNMYQYNSIITINEGIGIEFGQSTGVYEIIFIF